MSDKADSSGAFAVMHSQERQRRREEGKIEKERKTHHAALGGVPADEPSRVSPVPEGERCRPDLP